MPKVNVIIPTYNCAKYLPEAINSVLDQTYQDYEIIIVDDGSTDNTKEIIEQHNKSYPNKIKYIYQKNKGPAAARNTGIKEATGEFIAFLDADDIWLPGSIEQRVYMLRTYRSIDLVFSDYYLEKTEKEQGPPFLKKREFISNFSDAISEIDGIYVVFNEKYFSLSILKNQFASTPAVMIRKSFFEFNKAFREDLKAGEDHELWYRASKNNHIGFVDAPTFVYKRYRGSHLKNIHTLSTDSISFLREMLITADKNKEMTYAIKKRMAYFENILGDWYALNNKKALAISSYIRGIYYCFHDANSWLSLLKAFLPFKARMKLRTLKKRIKLAW